MIRYASQIGQDKFVINQLNGKKEGTFLDIGCGYPIFISNTFALEKFYDWSGIGVDISNQRDKENPYITWESERPKTKHIIDDALKVDYLKLLVDNNMPTTIDYLSIDLEPPSLTLECLFKIPFDNYKFRVITFETDEYRDEGGDERVRISREYLLSKNYRLVQTINRQDDFYVLNELI
jgi:hypothetical protein